jgi:hypothetical protein
MADDKAGAKPDSGAPANDDTSKAPGASDAASKAGADAAADTKGDATPDEKPAGDKPAADASAEGKAKPATDATTKEPAGPPEKYAFVVPEGAKLFIDDTDLAKLDALARASGLDNTAANEVLAKQAQAYIDQSAQFRLETEADDTYGGAKLQETERLATAAMTKFAPAGTPLGDQLRRDLVKTGFGNKLSVVSFLARIGKAMAEDQPGGSGGTDAQTRDAAQILYGKT